MKKKSPDSIRELFNELRNEDFEQRARGLNRWLAATGIFLSLISLIAIFGGAAGYFSLRTVQQEAIEARDGITMIQHEAIMIGEAIQILYADARRNAEQIEEQKRIAEQAKKVEQQPEDDWSRTFDAYGVLFRLAGFEPYGDIRTGSLRDADVESFELILQERFSYKIMGLCNESCDDLDLTLYRGDDLMDLDFAADSVPILDYLPNRTGTFRIEVQMYSCASNSCDWAVQVSRRIEPNQ